MWYEPLVHEHRQQATPAMLEEGELSVRRTLRRQLWVVPGRGEGGRTCIMQPPTNLWSHRGRTTPTALASILTCSFPSVELPPVKPRRCAEAASSVRTASSTPWPTARSSASGVA